MSGRRGNLGVTHSISQLCDCFGYGAWSLLFSKDNLAMIRDHYFFNPSITLLISSRRVFVTFLAASAKSEPLPA